MKVVEQFTVYYCLFIYRIRRICNSNNKILSTIFLKEVPPTKIMLSVNVYSEI